MATISFLNRLGFQKFLIEIWLSVLPMIIAGLYSTQIRIRQSTYQFVSKADEIRQFVVQKDKDGMLMKAIKHAHKNLEDGVYNKDGARVVQVNDNGAMMLEHLVQLGEVYPTTLTPTILNGDVEWAWYHPNKVFYPLGEEEAFTEEEWKKVKTRLEAKVMTYKKSAD